MDTELLTIEQVAERAGLSAHTLRYYERIGLLDPVGRATSGHRRYATKDLAWIEFLTRLRATGMPIRLMQEFAALRRQGNTTIARRCALLEAHQQMVQTHIEELQQNLKAISHKIEMYHQGRKTKNRSYDLSSTRKGKRLENSGFLLFALCPLS